MSATGSDRRNAHFSRRQFVKTTGLASGLVLGVGLGRVSASRLQAKPKSGGNLKVALNTDVDTVDPHKSAQNTGEKVRGVVYSQLVRYSDERQLVTDLAEKYEQVDPTTYRFHLRSGVKFHDGVPLTAADVVASYQRILDPATGSRLFIYLKGIETVTAVDNLTVDFKLKAPQVTFVAAMALPGNSIAQKKKIDAKVDFEKDVVGTGPFKFGSRAVGVETKVERNPTYFQSGMPYLDSITYRPFDDDSARMNSLLSGDSDIGTFVPWVQMSEFENNPDYVFQSVKDDGFIMLEFRVDRPPFNNQQLRQAINYGLDRTALMKSAASGRGAPCFGGIVPSWMFANNKEIADTYKFDPAKAKQLIKAAGAEGLKIELTTNPATDYVIGRPSIVVANQLNQLGLKVTLKQVANAAWSEIRKTGNYQMFADGSLYDLPDPDFLSNYYQTGGRIPKANRFSDPEIDGWLDQGRQEADKEKRQGLYDNVQKRGLEAAPIAWLLFREQGDAWKKDVKGYTYSGSNSAASALMETWLDR